MGFFVYCYCDHRDLHVLTHSFPTLRSADLGAGLLSRRGLCFGRGRFEAIAASSGLGPQLISARLKRLVAEGVVERQAYRERPPRYEYRLTAKGRDLFDVLYAMRGWAERWAYRERSEERRGGKECVRTCRTRWSPEN